MLLLTGAPASGKTSYCVAQLRQDLRAHSPESRLLTPTTTMAEHLRNVLAREGLVFSPRAVSTFGKFVAQFHAGLQPLSSVRLELIVREQLLQLPLDRYASVREFAGFRSALVRAIEEYSGAGGTEAQLRACDPDFAAVWAAVGDEVARLGLHGRAARLHHAAEQILAGPSLGRIFVTGFFGFTPPELRVLRALDGRSELVVALPESDGARDALRTLRSFAAEERRFDDVPERPPAVLFTAPTADGEANEIARRVLEERKQGRPFHQMGVIVRSEQPGVPTLQAAFERFGIPSRSYFSPPLRSDATVRYLLGLVDAALSGWDHETALPVLRSHGSPFEGRGDRFDFAVREKLPGQGLATLRELAPDWAAEFFDKLSGLTAWTVSEAAPGVWVQRFSSLPALFRKTEITDGVGAETALLWRRQNTAIEHFGAAVQETAAAFDRQSVLSCQEFRDALDAALSSASIRLVDRRRDVVHLIDAVEARQWRLPVVFVCGLLEQQFPKHQTEDPILSDEIRRELRSLGLAMRTSGDRQADENFLFDLAITRSTEKTILSYPELNSKGEPNLPSFLLEPVKPAVRECAVPVKPPAVRPRAEEPQPGIFDENLKQAVALRHATVSPSSIEAYLQCPYSFFIERTLRLSEPPAAPWDRFSPGVQGSIGHRVFELVFGSQVLPVEAFEQAFAEYCGKEGIPDGYRTEAIRLELLHGVQQLLQDRRMAPNHGESYFEKDFRFELAPGLTVRGKIDRLDVDSRGQAIIIDYKYKRKARIDATVRENEKGRRVQTGLYLIGAKEHAPEPAGMVYSGFKRESSVGGWVLPNLWPELQSACSAEHLLEVIATAKETTLRAHQEIVGGRIAPAPVDQKTCDFCSLSASCRVESLPEEAVRTADAE